MKQAAIRAQLVQYIPEKLDSGVLYVSQQYRTAAHRCCCGCGEEVITPLGPTDWTLQIVNGAATLDPSIGNWSFPCRSHYWIRSGKVVWAADMTQHQIQQGRMRDQRLRDAYFANADSRDIQKPVSPSTHHNVPTQTGSWLAEVWGRFKRFLGL
jgi:hypothetical protein